MLRRTNIYLPLPIINYFKHKAREQRETMAGQIRKVLEMYWEREKKDWVTSLLSFSRKAGKSGLGDLSKKHNQYLYSRR